MPSVDQTIRLYQDLSEWYERQGQAKLRDWFLVLAADAALSGGRADEAERFRARLLQINPHHLLKPFASMADALKSPDVQGYVAELRRAYPPQAAEQLLESQKATAAMAPPRAPATKPSDQPAEKRAPAAPVPAPADDAPLKVFRGKNMPDEPRPPAKPLSSWESAAPKAPPKMVPPAPPPAAPPRQRQTYAANPSPAAPLPTRRPDDLDSRQGRWVSSALFGLMLLFSLALAGYCFARPFLPAAWIPF